MTLYCKAGPDGTSVGDCPFAHYVRLVLHEKNLEYDLRPSTPETKPLWLVDQYQGKMPALRHRQECYIESDVICEYLDFFFPSTPPMKPKSSNNNKEWQAATDAIDGLFPSVAKYLKHTPDGDEEDLAIKATLQAALQKLEQHLSARATNPLFLVGDHMTLLDCSLVPKLYHLQTGIQGFKGESGISIEQEFPSVHTYLTTMITRPSFQDTSYPTETILWGWGNARSAA